MRLGAEIARLLNQLLLAELKDPGLYGIRVTEVEVTRDLGTARIYFSTLNPDEDAGPALEAFGRAAGFVRSRIGREIRLRRVPELRFVRDDSARRGMELTRLIADVAPGPPDGESDNDSDASQPLDPDRHEP
jgi:ribosome-binding factor A